jgi:hypothetical protein
VKGYVVLGFKPVIKAVFVEASTVACTPNPTLYEYSVFAAQPVQVAVAVVFVVLLKDSLAIGPLY